MRRSLASTNYRGFSLVEVIVYVAILVVVSTIAVGTLLLIQSSLAEIRVTRSLSSAASLSMERMTRVIRDASATNFGASTFNSSPGVLSISGSETPPEAHRFFVQGFQLIYEHGVSPPVSITPSNVLVTSLIFRSTTTPNSEGVRIELTLETSSGRATTSQKFYGSAVLRGAYAQ